MALDVKTGKLLWYHQFGPADEHDHDLSQVSLWFWAGIKQPLAGRDVTTITVTVLSEPNPAWITYIELKTAQWHARDVPFGWVVWQELESARVLSGGRVPLRFTQ